MKTTKKMVPLCERLWEMQHERQHTDLRIVTKEGQVFAHRAVLAFCCHPLKLILEDQRELEESIVIAKEFSSAEVLTDLEQVYLGCKGGGDGGFHFAFLDKFGCCDQASNHSQSEASMTGIYLPHVTSSKPSLSDAETTMVRLSALRKRKRPQLQPQKISSSCNVAAMKSMLSWPEQGPPSNRKDSLLPDPDGTALLMFNQSLQRSSIDVSASSNKKSLPPKPKRTAFLAANQTQSLQRSFCDDSSASSRNHSLLTDAVGTELGCDLCSRKFSDSAHLEAHNDFSHEMIRCCHCKIFVSRTSIGSHMKEAHPRSYKCKLCQVAFEDRECYESHMLMHQGNKSCTFCQRCFTNHEDKSQHEDSCLVRLFGESGRNRPNKFDVDPTDVQGDAFHCLYCDTVMKSVRMLKNHVKVQHMYKDEVGKFHCSICNKNVNPVSRHVLIHINPQYQKYKCDYCDKRFLCRSKVVEHSAMYHTGENLFKCKFCPATFKRTSNRSDHHRVCVNNPNPKGPKKRTPWKRKPRKQDARIINPADAPSTVMLKGPLRGYNADDKAPEKIKSFTNNIGGEVNDQILAILGKK